MRTGFLRRLPAPGKLALLWLLALCAGSPALGQSKAPAADADIANYQGADRAQRLADGGKREGVVNVYTSAPVDDMAIVAAAFEKKTGIKVRVWRASSENVLQRGVAESRARRFEADVFETNGPEMESLHRENLLKEVKSPYLADLFPEAILPHREWVGDRLNIFTGAFNTRLVKKEDLPRTYEDLLHPRWKGKLGIEAEDLDWFAGIIKELGEARGLKLFRDIVTANGLSVRKGHTLLTNLVVSGEVPVALTVYNYKAEQLKNKGAPIDWFVIAPAAIARFQGVGVSRGAPHPAAAVLFFDYMLTDAQELLVKRDFIPSNRKIRSSLNKITLKYIDPRIVLDDNEKWTRLYKEIITNQGR